VIEKESIKAVNSMLMGDFADVSLALDILDTNRFDYRDRSELRECLSTIINCTIPYVKGISGYSDVDSYIGFAGEYKDALNKLDKIANKIFNKCGAKITELFRVDRTSSNYTRGRNARGNK
jgi:hypothetical protein